MSGDQKMMSDMDLDRLLAVATTPALAEGFEHRMMATIGFSTANNVFAFPKKQRGRNWLVGLPLAASLALGLWLGASGSTTNLLSSSSTEVAITDDGSDSGFEDIISVMEGKTS